MKIYACGEAQSLNKPGEFLDGREFGRVVGLINLGSHNGQNDYGWSGVKAVIHVSGFNYVLDFPAQVRIETDDGLAFIDSSYGDPNSWAPDMSDLETYDLYLFHLPD